MIELWKDNTGSGVRDTIKVDGAPFDLTGCSVKFRMRPELETTLKIDHDATVAQNGNVDVGVVNYAPVAGDVDTAGFFMGWWHVTLVSGKTIDTDEFVVLVREHGSSIDLCTVADVKQYIGETSADYDEELADLVAAASQAMLARTGREFRPFTVNPSTRVFDIDADVVAERALLVGDLASFTAVAINNPDGSLLQQVDVATVVAYPRIREPWRPIAELVFGTGQPGSAVLFPTGYLPLEGAYDSVYPSPGYTIAVNGAWGFPQVPADVRRAVKQIAAAGLARDVKRRSNTLRDSGGSGLGPTAGGMHEFPLSAEQVARRYRDTGM